MLDMVLLNDGSRSCTLHDVLYVPKLSCNLLSVAKASQKGKIVKFTKCACYLLVRRHKTLHQPTKVGSLYQQDHKSNLKQATFAEKADTKEDIGTSILGICEWTASRF